MSGNADLLEDFKDWVGSLTRDTIPPDVKKALDAGDEKEMCRALETAWLAEAIERVLTEDPDFQSMSVQKADGTNELMWLRKGEPLPASN